MTPTRQSVNQALETLVALKAHAAPAEQAAITVIAQHIKELHYHLGMATATLEMAATACPHHSLIIHNTALVRDHMTRFMDYQSVTGHTQGKDTPA